MKDKRITILLVIALVMFAETTYIAFRFIGKISAKKNKARRFEIYRRLSDEYLNQGLYKKAIDSYERYIMSPRLGEDKKSNLSYIIGNIYMDNLSDYKNALASFVRAKVLLPKGPNVSEVNKKIVMCLERMNRPVDAEREISKITSIEKHNPRELPKSKEREIIVAKIGDRDITMAELNSEIEKLPSYMRDEYKKNDKKKLEFLQQYITGELLYDSARRRGYDNDKGIIDSVYRAKKRMMIQKLITEEVQSKVGQPADMDLKLYYEAHKDKYIEETKDKDGKTSKWQRSFDEVKDQVRSSYLMEKQDEQMKALIDNLTRTKEVRIYEDMFKDKGRADEKNKAEGDNKGKKRGDRKDSGR